MSTVSFGSNAQTFAPVSLRNKIRSFYTGTLQGELVKTYESVDVIRFADDFYLGISFTQESLTDDQFLRATWLEIKTDAPSALKEKVLEFGVKEIEYWDKEHFYFQAPGGQVYRISG